MTAKANITASAPTAVVVAAGGTFTAGASITLVGAASGISTATATSANNATVGLGAYQVTNTLATTFNTNAALSVTINGTATAGTNYGQLVTGTLTVANTALMTVVPTFTGGVSSGTKIKIINSTGATTYTAGSASTIAVTDTSMLLSYAIAADTTDTDDVNLVVSHLSSSSLASLLGLTTNEGTVLSSALTASLNYSAGFAALAALSTSTAAKNALVQLESKPTLVGAGAMASVGANSGAIGGRQAITIATSGKYDMPKQSAKALSDTGVSSGDGSRDKAVWMEGFHTWADQDVRDGIAGYDSRVTGFALGGDAKVGNDMRLGASISYASADVDGDDVANSKSDSDTWTVSAYGTKMLESMYINGLLSYGNSDTDTKRSLTFVGTTASGSYNTDIWNAMVGAGMPQMVGDISVIPNVGMQLTHMSSDSYTESGASAFNLTVNTEDQTLFILKAGVDVADEIKVEGGTLVPELKLGVSYDLNDDETEATQTFTGGGASSKVLGPDPANFAGTLGLGLSFTNQDGSTTMGVSYSGEWKADYSAHTAMANVRFNF